MTEKLTGENIAGPGCAQEDEEGVAVLAELVQALKQVIEEAAEA
jgi:hypothetical protein